MLTVSMVPPRFLTVSPDGTPRYHTMMAYSEDADCSDNGARINYFSNPAVEINNLPTGDHDHNNAQAIRDNAVRFLNSSTHVSQFEAARAAHCLAGYGRFELSLTVSSCCGRVVLERKASS